MPCVYMGTIPQRVEELHHCQMSVVFTRVVDSHFLCSVCSVVCVRAPVDESDLWIKVCQV